MQTKNFKPTAEQKAWHDELAGLGCLLTGAPAEIDHLIGASAKQDKIWIGQWCVVPLSDYWHRNGPVNRTSERDAFRRILVSNIMPGVAKNIELELFSWACANYVFEYKKDLPFGGDVLSAIYRYLRG